METTEAIGAAEYLVSAIKDQVYSNLPFTASVSEEWTPDKSAANKAAAEAHPMWAALVKAEQVLESLVDLVDPHTADVSS